MNFLGKSRNPVDRAVKGVWMYLGLCVTLLLVAGFLAYLKQLEWSAGVLMSGGLALVLSKRLFPVWGIGDHVGNLVVPFKASDLKDAGKKVESLCGGMPLYIAGIWIVCNVTAFGQVDSGGFLLLALGITLVTTGLRLLDVLEAASRFSDADFKA